MKTVVALFDDVAEARAAVEDLVDNGIPRDDISLVARDVDNEYSRRLERDDDGDNVGEGAAVGATGGAVVGGLAGVLVGVGALAIPGIGPVVAAGPIAAGLAGAGIGAVTGGIIGALAGWGIPEEEAEYYAEGVRRGGTLVAVRISDELAEDVVDIMEDNDPVDVERRAAYWRAEHGWTGYDPEAEPYDAEQIGTYREQRSEWEADYDEEYDEDYDFDVDEDETIEVAEEEMRVGKRETRGGAVRVHSHVVSEPVEEDVRLRHEEVDVERRPANRPADETDFEEKTVEMTETHEEPVVDKRARVIEEVVLHKDTDVVDETVRGNVRRTEVEVDETGDGWDGDGSRFEDYDQEFRRHYNDSFATSDYDYNQYRSAYRYGHSLGMEPRYRDADWNNIEPTVKGRWEETNEGTWDEFKDAVRHGWQRTKQAVS